MRIRLVRSGKWKLPKWGILDVRSIRGVKLDAADCDFYKKLFASLNRNLTELLEEL